MEKKKVETTEQLIKKAVDSAQESMKWQVENRSQIISSEVAALRGRIMEQGEATRAEVKNIERTVMNTQNVMYDTQTLVRTINERMLCILALLGKKD